MSAVRRVVAGVLLLATGLIGSATLAGCTTPQASQVSEEESCARSGGIWRGTTCERARGGY